VERKVAVFVGGGVAFPLGPSEFKDAWKMGTVSVGGGVAYSITPLFAIVGYLDYNKFAFDEDGFLKVAGLDELLALAQSAGVAVSVDVEGADVSILTASANGKFSVEGESVSPYFLGGLGYFNLNVSDVRVTVNATLPPPYGTITETQTASTGSESAFFLMGGPGLDIHASDNVDVFVQGIVGFGLTKGESTLYMPVKAGVSVKF
jgi:hypothetical protein